MQFLRIAWTGNSLNGDGRSPAQGEEPFDLDHPQSVLGVAARLRKHDFEGDLVIPNLF
jgi:hypothetical protein